MPPRGIVRAQHRTTKRDPGLTLAVPVAIVRELGLEPGEEFRVEVTDEGLLYRPVQRVALPDPRPAWRR